MNKQTVSGDIVVWHPLPPCDDLPYDGYSISYIEGGWLPGTYDSEGTAVHAGELCLGGKEEEVCKVRDSINNYKLGCRVITMSDLKGISNA